MTSFLCSQNGLFVTNNLRAKTSCGKKKNRSAAKKRRRIKAKAAKSSGAEVQQSQEADQPSQPLANTGPSDVQPMQSSTQQSSLHQPIAAQPVIPMCPAVTLPMTVTIAPMVTASQPPVSCQLMAVNSVTAQQCTVASTVMQPSVVQGTQRSRSPKQPPASKRKPRGQLRSTSQHEPSVQRGPAVRRGPAEPHGPPVERSLPSFADIPQDLNGPELLSKIIKIKQEHVDNNREQAHPSWGSYGRTYLKAGLIPNIDITGDVEKVIEMIRRTSV